MLVATSVASRGLDIADLRLVPSCKLAKLSRPILKRGRPFRILKSENPGTPNAEIVLGILELRELRSVCCEAVGQGATEVVNHDPPDHKEDYVHRAGRVGRTKNAAGIQWEEILNISIGKTSSIFSMRRNPYYC